MADPVQIEVKSDLRKIIADLEALSAKADGVSEHLGRAGNETEKNLDKNTKDVETMLDRVRDLGRRMADQIRGYFKDLATHAEKSLEEARKDLGLKKQFIDATKEAVNFNSVLHRIGTTLGMNNDQIADFQKAATNAFSAIGMDADAASRALDGVSQTQVRGKDNMLKTATTGAELAELSGQKGQEGTIAKGLADTLQAEGKNPNDMEAMEKLAEDLRHIFNSTGTKPTDALGRMSSLYDSMAPESRKKINSEGMSNLTSVGAVVGNGFDSLIKEMTQGHLAKLPMEAQGFGGLISNKGVNFDVLKKIEGIGKRIGGDQVAAFQTSGLSEEASRALVKLLEMRQQAQSAQERSGKDIAGGPTSVAEQAKQARGLPENFEAAKNQVKGVIGSAEAPIIQGINNVVGKASETKGGSAALLGGGFLAATAASYGIGKLSKLLGGHGGIAQDAADSLAAAKKAATVEQITGQKTMPVYVVNVAELATAIGSTNGLPGTDGAGGLTGTAGKAASLAKSAGQVIGAAGLGYAAGQLINEGLDAFTTKTDEVTGVTGNIAERGFARVTNAFDGGQLERQQKQLLKANKDAADAQARATSAAAQKQADAIRQSTNKKINHANQALLRTTAKPNSNANYGAPK